MCRKKNIERETTMTSKRKPMQVQVVEENEIAGELVRNHVSVFFGKTLHSAREYAEKTWNGHPPRGARIIDARDWTVFDIPSTTASASITSTISWARDGLPCMPCCGARMPSCRRTV